MSVNKCFILGNVGRDPDIRNNGKIANLSVATSEQWKDKRTGERREKTEWHRVVVFNEKLVEVIEKYVRKGSRIHVEGKVQTRKWTGQDGVERITTEVVIGPYDGSMVLLSDGKQSDSRSQQQQRPRQDDLDDPIPF